MPKIAVTVTLEPHELVELKRNVGKIIETEPELLTNASAVRVAVLYTNGLAHSANSPFPPTPTAVQPPTESAETLESEGSYTPSPPESHPLEMPAVITKDNLETVMAPHFEAAQQELESNLFKGLELDKQRASRPERAKVKAHIKEPWHGCELADWSTIKDTVVMAASNAEDIPLVLAFRVVYAALPRERQGSEQAYNMVANIIDAYRTYAKAHPDKLPSKEVILKPAKTQIVNTEQSQKEEN